MSDQEGRKDNCNPYLVEKADRVTLALVRTFHLIHSLPDISAADREALLEELWDAAPNITKILAFAAGDSVGWSFDDWLCVTSGSEESYTRVRVRYGIISEPPVVVDERLLLEHRELTELLKILADEVTPGDSLGKAPSFAAIDQCRHVRHPAFAELMREAHKLYDEELAWEVFALRAQSLICQLNEYRARLWSQMCKDGRSHP